jgi:hypothetical protein
MKPDNQSLENLQDDRWHAAHLLSDYEVGALAATPEAMAALKREIADLDAQIAAHGITQDG